MDRSLIDNLSLIEPEANSMETLPSGTLTFLFTDIEGSTKLWEQHPEQMRVDMARHDALIESSVIQHGGRVVRPRGEGDSRFAVFPHATEALRAAIAIQLLLLTEPWTVPQLQIRIALHSGYADLRDGDYYGSAVNRCARLRSVAHGGQILVSQSTFCLTREELPPGVSLRDLGEYNLRGLKQPEHIYQVVSPKLPTKFPPLKTPGSLRNNLPVVLTSFIGREHEKEEVAGLLSQTRLLTITGTGGAGKTRLALQVAENMLDSYPDGIWFIDLAPLSNPANFNQYAMNLLGIREEAGCSPGQTLMGTLYSKAFLLILDNCEHLLPDMAQLVENMLRCAPMLRILATSREKLGAPGEILWPIPPLSLPDTSIANNFEQSRQYEAVKLFLDRAVAVRPDFTISRENIGEVVQVCARLDGIPLAIELAAARVRVLSVEEIAARLDDRFRLLVGSHTALPRQQTLRALIDWSYDLLIEKERVLLRRLSVFSGGWTLQAAEQICSGSDVEAWEVLDLLTGLIDKSFVIGETQNGHRRYHFLETILKYSQERLLDSTETGEFAHKHAGYFLKVTADSYGKMWGNEQACWLKRLDEDRDNLRAALEFLSNLDEDQGMLLKMAGSLWRYWEIRGYFSEGRAWLEAALTKDSNSPSYWRANALGGAGHLARQQGDYVQAKTMHEQSLAIFRALGCKMGAARQLNALGEIARFLGDYTHSIELHNESLSLRYEIADKEGIAVSLRQLGSIARDRGQYEHAEELLEESLKLERELGDKLLVALSLNDLGLVAYHLCNYDRAVSLFEEAVSIQRELNDRLGISNSLKNLGKVAKDRGDFKRAYQLYKECLALKQDLGDKRGITGITAALAEVAFWQGKYSQAADLAGQSLKLSQELSFKRGVLNSFELLGFIAFYQGNREAASSCAEKGLKLSTEMDAPQTVGYAKELLALIKYSEGNLVEASDKFHEALAIFKKINNRRDMAVTYVNLARTAYRQGDRNTAMHFLDKSLATSKEMNTRWNLAFVLEIMGLLQRSEGNFGLSLELFRESLDVSVEQENQQGIANCLGGLAGLAVIANQPQSAARLFAAAARLRHEMGAKMSRYDQLEYEHYLDMVHDHLDHMAFEVEWSEGFTMTTDQIIEELKGWSGNFEQAVIPNQQTPSLENLTK